MILLSSSDISYNNNINYTSEKVNAELLTLSVTPSKSNISHIFSADPNLVVNVNMHMSRMKMPRGCSSYYDIWDVITHNRNPKTGRVTKNRNQVAELSGYSESTVQRALAYFESMGWIRFGLQIKRAKNKMFSRRPVYIVFKAKAARHESFTNIPKVYGCNNNNIDDNKKDIPEEVTQDFKKEFQIDSFWASHKNELLMKYNGIDTYLKQIDWIREFREIMRTQKPWNGDPEWNFENSNYAFGKYFRTEIKKYRQYGNARYIRQLRREAFRSRKKPEIEIKKTKPEIEHKALERIDRSNDVEVDFMVLGLQDLRNKLSN